MAPAAPKIENKMTKAMIGTAHRADGTGHRIGGNRRRFRNLRGRRNIEIGHVRDDVADQHQQRPDQQTERQVSLRLLDLPAAEGHALPSLIGPEGRHQSDAETGQHSGGEGSDLRLHKIGGIPVGKDEDQQGDRQDGAEFHYHQDILDQRPPAHADIVDGHVHRNEEQCHDLLRQPATWRKSTGDSWSRKATASVAMAPESMTRNSDQPKRNAIREPKDSLR